MSPWNGVFRGGRRPLHQSTQVHAESLQAPDSCLWDSRILARGDTLRARASAGRWQRPT